MDETSMDDVLADENQDVITKKLVYGVANIMDTIDKCDWLEWDSFTVKMSNKEDPVFEFALKFAD